MAHPIAIDIPNNITKNPAKASLTSIVEITAKVSSGRFVITDLIYFELSESKLLTLVFYACGKFAIKSETTNLWMR